MAGEGTADGVAVAGGGEPVLIVDEWHVNGDPTTETLDFPLYHFVYRSDDQRWPGTEAGHVARDFVERCRNETDPAKRWRSGPQLFHRTVTYSALEPVPLEQETPDRE